MPHVSNNKWYCLIRRRSIRSFIYTSIQKGYPTPRHILIYYSLSSNHAKPRNYNVVKWNTNLRETSECLSDMYLSICKGLRNLEYWIHRGRRSKESSSREQTDDCCLYPIQSESKSVSRSKNTNQEGPRECCTVCYLLVEELWQSECLQRLSINI